MKKLLAFDLGAESGRGVLGQFDGERLGLEVVHRFPNGPVQALDAVHWDVLRLYGEMIVALRRCVAEKGGLDSVGVDTWGVDFALLGRGTLLGNPRHYRDPYTETAMEEVFRRVSRREIFFQTGIQFMRFNSLYQLWALKRERSPLLDVADSLLFIPDLLNFFLTGIKVNELTVASTSQMYDPESRAWAHKLMKSLELPGHLLGNIVSPGTVLGPLRPALATETGAASVPVIAPATHDTASAVAAVPARGTSWAYISSGTWSLMGAELPAPLITAQALDFNFTNEVGVGGSIRLLKNIMGLWLVQECRRSWERAGQVLDYEELTRLAGAAPRFVSLIDPDDSRFVLPQCMPTAIAEFCRRTGQPALAGVGPTIRCALESLALRYRWVLDRLEELLGRRLDVVHIVGGGSQNRLLCQLTADACDRPVVAGPAEATAIGNVLVQAIGLGLIGSLADGREIVRRSFEVTEIMPQDPGSWSEPYQRWLGLLKGEASKPE